MANFAIIRVRVTPIVQAIPRKASVSRAEVLSTLRKHGTSHFVTRPSRGNALHRCSRSGYDLILEVSPAPPNLTCSHQ